jgi:channel protein (hemolysin III family)
MFIMVFVGGMEFTRPLDALIEKFEINTNKLDIISFDRHRDESQNATTSAQVQQLSIQLWHSYVEINNPTYFNLTEEDNDKAHEILEFEGRLFEGQISSDANLYDTSLDYLLVMIQKFAHISPKNNEKRENIYQNFLDIQPAIIKLVDSAIEYNKNQTLEYNVIALQNIKRNIDFHFKSENVIKDLIVTGDINQDYSKIHEITRVPLYIFMASAIICLSFSSFFHLFTCYNHNINNYLSRLDYGGISFLIAGSCMPPYFYCFYCPETKLYAYLYTLVILGICFLAFVVTLLPRFDSPKYRKFRALLYVAAGLSSAIPVFHLILGNDKYVYPLPIW